MKPSAFNAEPVLGQLKDFQRASVEHAFAQLYEGGVDRFLVADEVGLGKTMVARGLIAKTIERLWDDVERIDVVYICSNGSIAQQNIRRLNVMPDQGFSFSSRMTMIARQVAQLEGNKVNFVSFTPGTSFDLKSRTGQSDERVLLYWLLHLIWGGAAMTAPGAERVLQCGVSNTNWPNYVKLGRINTADLDAQLLVGFEQDLDELNARERFDEMASSFTGHIAPRHAEVLRDSLIGDLRVRLASRCVRSLEPDLVILDEFQRFRQLMSGDDDAAQLAQSLFNHDGNKTVLLSATPYKMYTTGDDTEDNHHRDFIETVRFLSPGVAGEVEAAMADFRRAILDIQHRSVQELETVRRRVERALSKIMVRTERLGAADDRNGMLTEVDAAATLAPVDITAFVGLDGVAQVVNSPGMVEYWKSVPRFINFCDGYKVDKQIRDALTGTGSRREVKQKLKKVTDRIDWDTWTRFASLGNSGGRLGVLEQQTLADETWRMLWLAPSLPYYELGGPWNSQRASFTKRLIFSSWAGVPKAISSLLSYEVEAAMFGLRPVGTTIANTPTERASIGPLIRFPRAEGQPVRAMNWFSFVYPCHTLARIANPLAFARESRRTLTTEEVRELARERIQNALRSVSVKNDTSVSGHDPRWYWAAPLLLDALDDSTWQPPADRFGAHHWVDGTGDTSVRGGPSGSEGATRDADGFDEHVNFARAMYQGDVALGERPDDLLDVLVDVALGSPGTIALRSLGNVFGDSIPVHDQWLSACRIAWGFRSLFNRPDVSSMLRSSDWEREYWKTVVIYCTDGCLTAVLDEYLHVLREALGLFDVHESDTTDAANEIANAVQEAVCLRTITLDARDYLGESPGPSVSGSAAGPGFRTRYAMRFGNDRAESEASMVTADNLRRAFNSPFWPFVLSSTSIGQEGLDFHLYCHAIMHWNLPSNPVDLEQREGRVHRFKGHAVRRNVAKAWSSAAWAANIDPWAAMFDAAAAARPPTENELTPFWVYPGDSKIERHVPMLPMSREVSKLAQLKRDVASYRSVFGQARQDDMLEFLGDVSSDKLAAIRIDLSPPTHG